MTKDKCSINNIVLLGLLKNNYKDVLHSLTPFINEIANILTLSNIINIYPQFPKNDSELFYKMFFDLLSLVGIVSNVIKYNEKVKNYKSSLSKGLLLLIFTYKDWLCLIASYMWGWFIKIYFRMKYPTAHFTSKFIC